MLNWLTMLIISGMSICCFFLFRALGIKSQAKVSWLGGLLFVEKALLDVLRPVSAFKYFCLFTNK